jgi:Arc/MetJ-type ribon-helix-helix transcriptional regulator
LADVAKFRKDRYIGGMAETLNISLAPGQLAWLKARKQEEGFATASDVVRDLIRRQQEKERAALSAEFDQLKGDGAAGPEPVSAVMKVVRKVKKERRETHRRA